MTSTVNKILAVALVVQGGLVAASWTMTREQTVTSRPLLELDPETLIAITITGRVAPDVDVPEPLRLVREGDRWAIESAFGYPATDANVASVLDPLVELEVRTPMATQAYNHEALQVAEEAFTRKVELTGPEGTQTFYLGAAEGKGLNVRLGDTDDVYSVRGLSAWSIPDQANRFFDRSLLQVDPATVGSLTIRRPGEPPLELVRAEDSSWTSPALTDGQSLDDQATQTFVGKVVTLRMLEPAAASEAPEHGLDDGIEVTWTDIDGVSDEANRFRIGAEVPDQDEQYYLRWDGQPFVLRVRRGTLIATLETQLDALIDTVVDLDLE